MATSAPATPPAPAKTDTELMADPTGTFTPQPPEGKGAAAPPAAPERVKVKVGNEEIETDPTSAAALNALLQNNAQMRQLIEKGFTQPAATPPKKDAAYDYATGLFTEPEVALARLRAEIKQEIVGEVTASYTQAETRKDFWAGFYADNADLVPEKLIVNAVLGRDWDKLKELPAAEASKKLSEAAKKEILRLSGGKSPSDPNPRPVEGVGDGKTPPASGKPGEEKITSISDVIRARKEARRKAQFSKE